MKKKKYYKIELVNGKNKVNNIHISAKPKKTLSRALHRRCLNELQK